jgi:magnesium transporter
LLIVSLGALFPTVFPRSVSLAATAALALMIVVILATLLGATIPLILDKLGVDPALATGPFITTSNDILGIIVFFLLAQALYL